MIAADTNVVVRLLIGDEPKQTEQARHLFETETVFLPKTALLEAEWVLRRLYSLDRNAVLRALHALVSLPGVRCEDEPAAIQALAQGGAGVDFADALHLASSRAVTRFATFDDALIKLAAANPAGMPVSKP